VLLPLLLWACSDSAGSGTGTLGTGDAIGTIPDDTGTTDTGGSGDSGLFPPDVEPETDGSADIRPATGDVVFCTEDEDCPDSRCVFVVPSFETGICETPCASDDDCAQDATCELLNSSGTDQVSICIPIEFCIDGDGDGWGEGPDCDGRDCDDQLTNVNFGATETCDGIDNDCDGTIDNTTTEEGRVCETGFTGDCATGVFECQDSSLVCIPIAPPADEICDGIDNDCNGLIDDNPIELPTWYEDADEDLFGNANASIRACAQPDGYVENNEDCADFSAISSPTGTEICDGIDNNCDGDVDEGNPGAGQPCDAGIPGICNAGLTFCSEGIFGCAQTVFSQTEVCDNIDNDCDGEVDNGNPGGGDACATSAAGVCQAGIRFCEAGAFACRQTVEPTAEVCDELDNNCDGAVDEGFNKDWWADRDGDGFGDAGSYVRACAPPNEFYVQNADDANDGTQYIHPGRPEICDGADNNQDGNIDEGGVCAAAQVNGGDCRGYFGPLVNRGFMICKANSRPRNYNDQRTRCLSQSGMDLALPSNEAENQAIGAACNALFGGFGRMWIGVTRVNRDAPWMFVGTGALLTYTRWDSGEPSGDGDCVEMVGDFEWNDSNCGNSRDEAACEWNAENVRRF
jgi:hypothetical protein